MLNDAEQAAEDRAAIVFYDDANDNEQLDVDDGLPTEEWGFGLIDWSS